MPAFALLLGFASALGLAWIAWQAPPQRLRIWLDAGLVLLVGSLVGARLAYTAVNWGYYQSHSGEILQVFAGGLAWPGALLGGLLGLGLYALAVRQPLPLLVDAVLPLALLLAAASWLGCWLDGCAYGPQLNVAWLPPSPDEWGRWLPRIPTQLLGATLALGLLWALDRLQARFAFAGQAALWALLGLSLELLGLSFLRVDPAPFWNGLRLESWAALICFLLALLGLFLAHRQRQS